MTVTACIFGYYITLLFGLVNNVYVSTDKTLQIKKKKTPFEGDFLLTSIFHNALSK